MTVYSSNLPLEMRCDKCDKISFWENIDFVKYFRMDFPKCKKCGESADLFNVYINTISENFMFTDAFHCIGAHTSYFKMNLNEGVTQKIIFSEYGIPIEATILHVNYTPEGPLVPIEIHGNSPMLKKYFLNEISIYPARVFNESFQSDESNVNVSVTWILLNGEPLDNLITAFQHYYLGEYEKSIIPANVAVEYHLNQYLTHRLNQTASRKRVRDFLQNAATYSYQLNVLLPFILEMENNLQFKMLDEKIRGTLNQLRDYRNKIAHEGGIGEELDKKKCATLLTGALFGYLYIEYLNIDLSLQNNQ